ncbi:unnamed protein product [Rhizophagus irregularis]|nr:unnamed protein product [Rhizophagus irregularis]
MFHIIGFLRTTSCDLFDLQLFPWGSKDSSGAVAPVDNLKNTNNSSEASAGIDSPKDYLKIKENHQSQVFRIISKPSYRLTKERISNWAHMI